MNKHTSGQWHIFPHTDGKADIGPVSGANNLTQVVADCWHESEEDKANCCLIAAAPDILAACEHAEMALAGFTKPNLVVKDALAIIRKAIHKAEGGAE